MKRTPRIIIRDILVGIVKSWIIAFLAYIASTILLKAFLEDVEQSIFQSIAFGVVGICYAAANYHFFISGNTKEHMKIPDSSDPTYHPIEDLFAYIKGEGKYLLSIYGIFAILCEAARLVKSQNPISTVLLFLFPALGWIEVPVLRIILAYVLSMALLLTLTLYARKKNFDYWSKHN